MYTSDFHRLAVEEVYAHLDTGPSGLSSAVAALRLREGGANEIPPPSREWIGLKLVRQLTHFLAVLLWIAAGLAFLGSRLSPESGLGALSSAIVAVILVNAAFSYFQEERAERAAEALQALLPARARVVRDGREAEIPRREVVAGDLLALADGDLVPVDARIVEAHRLQVSNAVLTGESAPQPRSSAPSDLPLLEATDMVFAGTTIAAGRARAVSVATGTRTEFAHVARLAQEVRTEDPPLVVEIRRVTWVVTVISVATGAGFFALGEAIGRTFWDNFVFAIGILVANVPEGLLPTVTLALAMASQRMARRNALLKDLPSVEALGAVTAICTDKTGTLTEGTMVLSRIASRGLIHDVGDLVAGEAENPLLFDVLRFCNDATWEAATQRGTGDPLEVAILRALDSGRRETAHRLGEVPFDSERRRMTVVCAVGDRFEVLSKGAAESLLPCCTTVLTACGARPLGDAERRSLERLETELTGEGLRVLALAGLTLERPPVAADDESLEAGLVFLGLAAFRDPVRPEVAGAVAACRRAGIRVFMVTGDHRKTAEAVGREIGLVEGARTPVVEGRALASMSDSVLSRLLEQPTAVFARTSAEQKLRIVRVLRGRRDVVAVTGDGVNDAPALKAADVGVAMGRVGSDVAREAARIILLDDNFATIVAAIEEGRAIWDNVRKFITYIFTSNIPEIVPYLAFVLFGIPLPLTILQILAVDLGTDMVPALGLGVEPPRPDSMSRPPRTRNERLLNIAVLFRAYALLGPIEAVTALANYFAVLVVGGWSFGQRLAADDPLYFQATTACLAAIVITQVAAGLTCRSARLSLRSLGPFGNPVLCAGIAIELALLVLMVSSPVLQRMLGTAPLPWFAWLLPIPGAGLLLAVDEAAKSARRRGAE